MAEVDGNTGGADSTGTLTGSGQGTGQTAQPGANPTGAEVEGNDTTKLNEGTGATGTVREAEHEEKAAEKVAKAEERGIEVVGDGIYDPATGRVEHGEVVVTDGNGVTVTKTRA